MALNRFLQFANPPSPRGSLLVAFGVDAPAHAEPARSSRPWRPPVIKTVAAFANSRNGGTLLIGVADDGAVHGLASDCASLAKAGKDDRDLFQLHLNQILINAFPVDAAVKIEKAGQIIKKTAFYVRIGDGTREIADPGEEQKYAGRWSNPTVPDAGQ